MTEPQLNARRKNAQLSVGPRTSAGKKRSSLNAFRHGLTGQIIVHTPEDQEAFNKHCDGIRKDLDPEGALETNLAQAIAKDYWRLNRVRALENGIFALGQTEQLPQDSREPELDAALAPVILILLCCVIFLFYEEPMREIIRKLLVRKQSPRVLTEAGKP